MKIYLILNVYNIFCDNIPKIILPYLLNYEKEYSNSEESSIEIKNENVTNSYWINEESYYEKDENEEFYLIVSNDNLTKLYLLKNLRIVKIEYFQLLEESTSNMFKSVKNYKYLKTVKYYSINNIPSVWYTPLFLLISYFNLNVISSKYNPIDLTKIIVNKKLSMITYREFVNELPKQSELVFELHQMPDSHKEINPLVFPLSREFKIKFIYTQNYTYLITSANEVDIICNEYPHLINYTEQETSFLNYEQNDTIHLTEIDKYYKIIHNDSNFKIDSSLNEMIIELYNIKIFLKPLGIFKQPLTVTNNEVETDFTFDGNELQSYNQLKGVGDFYSYKNKAIKVDFFDRTRLKINSNHTKICIINKLGDKYIYNIKDFTSENADFIYYYNYSIQFYNFCYMSNSEKRDVKEHLNMIDQLASMQQKQVESHKQLLNTAKPEIKKDFKEFDIEK